MYKYFDKIQRQTGMRKIFFLIIALTCGIGISNAAVRDINSPKRPTHNTLSRQPHEPTNKTSARIAIPKSTQSQPITRPAPNNTIRQSSRGISVRPQTANTIVPRKQTAASIIQRTSRAATTLTTPASSTFNTDYNACREAYFTCMDQFCSNANDTYRRCICSSKLYELQSRERALTQTSEQLQDFKTFNIYAVDKTAAEATAMVTASAGEFAQENITDNSESASTLNSINKILSKRQSTPTSPADFSSNINISWNTSELIGGTNISDLTGETLYNTVNAQCLEMVSDSCPNQTTKQMVTAAYSMYIENDCSLLISNLDSKLKSANSQIRQTEYDLDNARLENYNAHNSSSINDCLSLIRQDLTAETACGPDYIHCLDLTGKYLNYQTGEPIYTADFYEFSNATSLDGDILTNNANNLLVSRLNDKKIFAQNSLNTCRDLSQDIWDEFLRQAITEIHQEQQKRIRQVKNECLATVVSCYEDENNRLLEFSDLEVQNIIGMRLELSETMCQEKLNACSNLYGGGSNGLQELVTTMHNIVSEQIANNCRASLEKFAKTLCSPYSFNVAHTYPLECRTYAPGNEICAVLPDYTTDTANCSDYNGSLYQKFAQYALETCIRPSESTKGLSPSVIQDINTVIAQVRTQLYNVLNAECEKHDGQWIQYDNNPKKEPEKNMKFYSQTPAHEKWGICITK